MKPIKPLAIATLLFISVPTPQTHALFGVGDTVVVTFDATGAKAMVNDLRQDVKEVMKWVKEATWWVNQFNQMYNLINRLGKPGSFWSKMNGVLSVYDGLNTMGSKAGIVSDDELMRDRELISLGRETASFGSTIERTLDTFQNGRFEGLHGVSRALNQTYYTLGRSNRFLSAVERFQGQQDKVAQSLQDGMKEVADQSPTDVASAVAQNTAAVMLGNQIASQNGTITQGIMQSQAELHAMAAEDQFKKEQKEAIARDQALIAQGITQGNQIKLQSAKEQARLKAAANATKAVTEDAAELDFFSGAAETR